LKKLWIWIVRTIRKVDQVQPLITSRVLQALEPKLACSICVSPESPGQYTASSDKGLAFTYLWNITHWATVTYEALESGVCTKVQELLTMLSCVSLRAESFAKTASSVYAILIEGFMVYGLMHWVKLDAD
jgi:hypothetical protein